ncbi:MAG TPA: isocitrate/isopropylmalate dehydrogenase family protein [Bryobacteraceae bacterium]|nr:isocitrate/isopropylmalate dehydrogenase family protein [Bryobacteraceae bacterium]
MSEKTFQIAVLGGDGIGPDVVAEAIKTLHSVQKILPHTQFHFTDYPAGAGEYLRAGNPLPDATIEGCRTADAILLGAMGLPGVRYPNGTEITPQIDLREIFDLYAGLRPIYLYNPSHSPLRGYAAGEIDFVIFRENTEGLFASRKNSVDFAAAEVRDTLLVTRHATERICQSAFRLAQKRRRHVTLVDKANVLPSMAYFRSIFDGVAAGYPDVGTDRVYVDAASLFLVKNPRRFDVLVMENMFGDILSDLAAGIAGGMGMAPSADIGDKHAVFQPSHGSAPDIAGQGIANPIATILSAALMLEWLDTVNTRQGADAIRRAVEQVCADPAHATPDIGGTLTTSQLGDLVAGSIRNP